MGDLSEDFKFLRFLNKQRRAENLANATFEGFTKHTDYHYSRLLYGTILDYWPTKNKWCWNDKIYHGDVHKFINKRLNKQGSKHD